ncbi:MAG: hypothetical protein KGL39_12245 [Patescibacteria group bacterium]|nr:hypothetical protein [Patescibacteria group bacterium]
MQKEEWWQRIDAKRELTTDERAELLMKGWIEAGDGIIVNARSPEFYGLSILHLLQDLPKTKER